MNIVKSLTASVVALIIFFLVTGVIEFLFNILDRLRGDKFLLQEIWSSILAAILGSYFAMKCIERLFSKYRRLIILTVYSTAHLAFLIWALYYMVPSAPKLGFGIKKFSIQILTPVASILTAFLALNESVIDREANLEDFGITDDDFE